MRIRPTKLGRMLLQFVAMIAVVGIWVTLFCNMYSLDPVVQP